MEELHGSILALQTYEEYGFQRISRNLQGQIYVLKIAHHSTVVFSSLMILDFPTLESY